MIGRRNFFALIGGAAVAGPQAVKSMAKEASSSLAPGFKWRGMSGAVNSIDDTKDEYDGVTEAFSQANEYRLIKAAGFSQQFIDAVNEGCPASPDIPLSISCFKSVSPIMKQNMARELWRKDKWDYIDRYYDQQFRQSWLDKHFPILRRLYRW